MDPPIFVPMPGFTADQTVYIRSYIWSLNNTIWSSNNASIDWRPSLTAAFNEYFGLPPLQPLPPLRNLWPQQSTPPAPQEAQKEVEQVKKMALHQATVEDDTESTAESTTKHGNSMLGNKSTLSSFSRLCTVPTSGDQAARLTNAPLFDCQQATFFVLLATSFFGSFLASQLGYIRCMASMEASGEG